MKNLLRLLALIATLALVAAACGSDNDSSETSSDASTETSAAPADEDEATDDDAPAELVTDVGVTDDEIRIAVITDLTGPFSPLTVPITDGTEAYWEWVNDNGGIAGRQIVVETVDTAYDVEPHGQFYEQFADEGDEGVLMVQTSTGSPHTASIRDDLIADGIAAIPLSWNSSWSTESGSNVFEWLTNYCIEAMNGVSYMADNYGSKIAIISSAGDYGEDGAIGAKKAAEALGLEVVYDGQALAQRGADPTPIVAGIVESGADFVWSTMDPTTFGGIMGGAVQAGFTGQWAGSGPNYNQALLGTAVGPALGQLYTAFSPYPTFLGLDSEGMDEIVAIMQEYRPDAQFLLSYVASYVMGEIARQGMEAAAAAGDLTRQGVVDALQAAEIDLKGLAAPITYGDNPDEVIPREVFIYDVDDTLYDGEATVTTGSPGSDGLVLIESNYVADAALDFEYEPCFGI